MPAAFPPEFRQRAVGLAREWAKPVVRIAEDLGISESCLRRWMAQADIDDGAKPGLTRSEREELVRLRRENRVLRMERDLVLRHFDGSLGWSTWCWVVIGGLTPSATARPATRTAERIDAVRRLTT
jgi:transposase-like protein